MAPHFTKEEYEEKSTQLDDIFSFLYPNDDYSEEMECWDSYDL